MAKAKLQVGDVVTLKSGGPPMTVSEIRGGKAVCVWFYFGAPAVFTVGLSAVAKKDDPRALVIGKITGAAILDKFNEKRAVPMNGGDGGAMAQAVAEVLGLEVQT